MSAGCWQKLRAKLFGFEGGALPQKLVRFRKRLSSGAGQGCPKHNGMSARLVNQRRAPAGVPLLDNPKIDLNPGVPLFRIMNHAWVQVYPGGVKKRNPGPSSRLFGVAESRRTVCRACPTAAVPSWWRCWQAMSRATHAAFEWAEVQVTISFGMLYTWPWGITYGSILGWMNIHLPPILMFTRGTGF